MADNEHPNQNANKTTAEGERWSSDENSVRNAQREETPAQQYGEESGDVATGISNRPLGEEIGNQDKLPTRNTTK